MFNGLHSSRDLDSKAPVIVISGQSFLDFRREMGGSTAISKNVDLEWKRVIHLGARLTKLGRLEGKGKNTARSPYEKCL